MSSFSSCSDYNTDSVSGRITFFLFLFFDFFGVLSDDLLLLLVLFRFFFGECTPDLIEGSNLSITVLLLFLFNG